MLWAQREGQTFFTACSLKLKTMDSSAAFSYAQQMLDSIVSDPDRLLGHWCNRALIPGSSSIRETVSKLLFTIIEQSLRLRIELMQSPTAVTGNIHIFDDPNFVISMDILTAYELKCLYIIVAPQHACSCFAVVHSDAPTNTKIFDHAKHKLHLTDHQRLNLVEKTCYHSLYLCRHLRMYSFLQLKDLLLDILLELQHSCRSSILASLGSIYQQLRGQVLSDLEQRIHNSPTTPRLRESVKEGRRVTQYQQQPQRRRHRGSPQNTQESRNFFLGSDWFTSVYKVQSLD